MKKVIVLLLCSIVSIGRNMQTDAFRAKSGKPEIKQRNDSDGGDQSTIVHRNVILRPFSNTLRRIESLVTVKA